MSDNKKYYYMRLKDSYFESDNMLLLESMPDGYLYSNILLKLYLRSLKDDGRLMLNGKIPYNPQMLATVTRHQVGTVEKALNIFRELGLIEVLDNGAIYMMDIQNYIGESSSEGDRKRLQRKRVDDERKQLQAGQMSGQSSGQMSGQMSDKTLDNHPPEIEIDIEIDIEREIEQEPEKKIEKEPEVKPEKTDGCPIEKPVVTKNENQRMESSDLTVGEKVNLLMQKYWGRSIVFDDAVHYLKRVLTDGEEDMDKIKMFGLALKISASKNACNWNYIDSIYQSWEEHGVRTPEDLKAKGGVS